VLSEPDRQGRRWDIESFLATGREHVAKALRRFEELGGDFPDNGLAIDFGSGVGRLTQPLAERFARVIGVDISPTMVAIANGLGTASGRIEYVVNDRSDLGFLTTDRASLLLSHIVLQHVPPRAASRYIKEFVRVVKPGGGIIFQVPSHFADGYLPHDRDDRPVATAARQARVDVIGAPAELPTGGRVEVTVEVTNLSGDPWTQSAPHPLNVGNHWASDDGLEILVRDDGRARLPGRLQPGHPVRIPLVICAPGLPGHYRLQFEVVQEGVGWFSSAGDQAATPRVTVSEPVLNDFQRVPLNHGDFGGLISRTYCEAPPFAMHGIPRQEVEDLLASLGARVLGADEWVTEWHSFAYYVQVGC
jgi:SAM-dependent methyltransferase